jgi:hypothetical protein
LLDSLSSRRERARISQRKTWRGKRDAQLPCRKLADAPQTAVRTPNCLLGRRRLAGRPSAKQARNRDTQKKPIRRCAQILERRQCQRDSCAAKEIADLGLALGPDGPAR